MKRLLLVAILILAGPAHVMAATGCSYPASHESFADRQAGDFLTVALLNQMLCAIENLEAGPVRPTDGSAATPAHSFRDDPDNGMYRVGTNSVGFSTAGTARWQIDSAGRLVGVGADSRILVGHSTTSGSAANDIVLQNTKGLRFLNAAGTTSTAYGITANASDGLDLSIASTSGALNFAFGGTPAGALQFQQGGMGLLFLTESTADHTAPDANRAVIYAKDNGSGKTQLCARFNSGSVQCFATQP